MRPEDLDPVDGQAVEVHEGHPVDLIVSVRLTPEDSRLLSELEAREGSDAVAILRAALREYAGSRLGGAAR
ncbi:MAG: hypothetical protein WKF41_19315 [Gaiellaceae bacterium]